MAVSQQRGGAIERSDINKNASPHHDQSSPKDNNISNSKVKWENRQQQRRILFYSAIGLSAVAIGFSVLYSRWESVLQFWKSAMSLLKQFGYGNQLIIEQRYEFPNAWLQAIVDELL
ncbi:MAG: hypothetical protein EZS28_042261 [Streblomastix strix]|uniref:Uncharacterized protein n=1 Tax=Streblomastix strix TaxID=222440 RepID=A0A5J4TWI4_9EUKA|nr:MAG: hypothetical protein EZS28_042261 [Streblomastix strix]